MSKRFVILCAAVAVAVAFTAIVVWRRSAARSVTPIVASPAPAKALPEVAAPAPAQLPESSRAQADGASSSSTSAVAAAAPANPAAPAPTSATPSTDGSAAKADDVAHAALPVDVAAKAAATNPTPDGAVAMYPRISEVDGTHRMIEAHAPLRSPEVANPDSTGNRRILQTMLSKAIIRRDTNAAAGTAK